MNRSKRLILVITAMVSSLILVMVPMITQVSPAQAAITWTKYGGVFDLLPEGVGAASVIYDSAEGIYKMWYTHGESNITIAGTTVAIGYATSPNRVTWTVQEATVLDGIGGGDWDDDSAGSPCVIKDGDTYKMWYTGGTTDGSLSGTVPAIGYAYSDNGTDWTKHDGAVLDGIGGGNWDDDSVGSPCVIYDSDADKYKMWYTGGTTGGTLETTELAIGYAESDDGITWTKHDGAVLEKSGGAWDSSGIGIACVVKVSLVYHMWYTGATGYSLDNVGAIGYAYSTNGTDWYPDSTPVLQKSSTWQSNGVDAPWVIRSDSNYYMWYTGIDSDSDPTIGYAYPYEKSGRGRGRVEEEEGITEISDVVTSEGVFTETITVASEDGNVVLTIAEGTTGLTVEGEPLSGISVTEMEEPPDPPADSEVIGLIYNLGPDGAIFVPPIELSITYDPLLIPEGVSQENLVIAMWDGEKWVNLECIVDPVAHTITARIGHFTAFTIIAMLPPPPPVPAITEPQSPTADFTSSSLTISPLEVDIGETVTISVFVTNTGDLEGTYKVTLKIDNIVEATEDITVAGHASRGVTFTTTKDVAGTYSVTIDGLSGTFEVKVAPPKPINWWLIAAIIAAAIAVPLAIRRRRLA